MSVGLLEAAAPAAPASSATAVELRNVSRWYGNVVAVNDISFSLGAGITGLLGPNGAGKSTILHMIAGFLAPSAGEVRVAGMTAWKNPEVYRHVGLVPEREAVYPFLTAYEFARMNARLHGLPDADAAAERAVDTVDLRGAMHRRIGGYSKGMRQRAKIAGALVHDPRILLLDEPFNGMDPAQRMQMMSLLKRLADEGRTILISSHILEELDQLANNVLVVVAGRLAASGHFREIRRLMTDRPHTYTLSSSDDRRLAAALMAEPSVQGLELGEVLTVRAGDRGSFALALPRVARAAGVTLYELRPTDESLESVFSYLVKR
ncbi:ABC transporter ATP-binding protein [Longimicrobium terrae]|uniref:ABC-2 type transport system ATP-binding protein n=1 Tax=Longimicrobium terrae TaxID=1639882 RepID=A0A841GYD9_9BACT|nr:ABC transporter ATP-binding protein [Longimicrobium terrae]MBB4636352.1 ABC-2 type transport system ATP-binding protein [Longimicrobium terrae]MBB6070748.1 ABC-2 type transport system ATP-binding protein [Longimicrobium terrae]NNC29727.1 ABC transporter ATP-binding protein [Longimicrobium terrae]